MASLEVQFAIASSGPHRKTHHQRREALDTAVRRLGGDVFSEFTSSYSLISRFAPSVFLQAIIAELDEQADRVKVTDRRTGVVYFFGAIANEQLFLKTSPDSIRIRKNPAVVAAIFANLAAREEQDRQAHQLMADRALEHRSAESTRAGGDPPRRSMPSNV